MNIKSSIHRFTRHVARTNRGIIQRIIRRSTCSGLPVVDGHLQLPTSLLFYRVTAVFCSREMLYVVDQ
jgi:hypothetical protein